MTVNSVSDFFVNEDADQNIWNPKESQ